MRARYAISYIVTERDSIQSSASLEPLSKLIAVCTEAIVWTWI